jgi:Zn-dependent peptidase ImmA (M78 family)
MGVSFSITRTRWGAAKSAADSLTADFTAPPIPVMEIAESSGVEVIFADFGEHKESVAGFCDFERAKLYVNADDMTERQTFTIAHELGHWILHRDLFLKSPQNYPVLPRFQSVDKNNPHEQEANHFAANLLVPERLLKPVIGAPLSVLAKVFGVSRKMMEFRVKNVG